MSVGGSPSLFSTPQGHVVTQCLFRGGHGRWLVLFAASAGVAVASTARPNTAARIFFMVPSRGLVGGHHGRCIRPSPGTDRDDALNVARCDTVAQCQRYFEPSESSPRWSRRSKPSPKLKAAAGTRLCGACSTRLLLHGTQPARVKQPSSLIAEPGEPGVCVG